MMEGESFFLRGDLFLGKNSSSSSSNTQKEGKTRGPAKAKGETTRKRLAASILETERRPSADSLLYLHATAILNGQEEWG
jgi:hypothetical protein